MKTYKSLTKWIKNEVRNFKFDSDDGFKEKIIKQDLGRLKNLESSCLRLIISNPNSVSDEIKNICLGNKREDKFEKINELNLLRNSNLPFEISSKKNQLFAEYCVYLSYKLDNHLAMQFINANKEKLEKELKKNNLVFKF